MRLVIYCSDDVTLDVKSFDEASALEFIEDLQQEDGSPFVDIMLDEGARVLLARGAIIRIDLDW